jgi:TatD DNase family protein
MEQFEGLVPKASWLGEVGLDGSPESRESLTEQADVFRRVLKASARAGGRVLSIHSRGAASAVVNELRAHPDAGTPVLHWFSGTLRELRDAIEVGCWFSVGKPMVCSKRGQALLEKVPKHRVLTETDGPFVQSNGQPDYPWDIQSTEHSLAECWKMEPDALRSLVHGNLQRLQSRG